MARRSPPYGAKTVVLSVEDPPGSSPQVHQLLRWLSEEPLYALEGNVFFNRSEGGGVARLLGLTGDMQDYARSVTCAFGPTGKTPRGNLSTAHWTTSTGNTVRTRALYPFRVAPARGNGDNVYRRANSPSIT